MLRGDRLREGGRSEASSSRSRSSSLILVGSASVLLELTALVGTTQQNISKHLVLLQRAGIVTRSRRGNFVYYRIEDRTIYALCESVCGSLQQRFDGLLRVADGRSGS